MHGCMLLTSTAGGVYNPVLLFDNLKVDCHTESPNMDIYWLPFLHGINAYYLGGRVML